MKIVGTPKQIDSVKSYLIPWFIKDDRPVTITIEGEFFIPIFTTEEQLQSVIGTICEASDYKIKFVTNCKEFFQSVKGHYRVCLDLRFVEGRVRFMEVFDETISN